MKVLQKGKLVRFSKKTVCLCAFSFSICNQTATSFGVSRATVPKVVTTYTNDEKTSSAERISGLKPKLSEMDHCTLKRTASKNHRTTAAKVTAELNIYLEDHFHKNSLMRASQIQHPQYSCNC
jgi:hypothetical protein